MSYCPLGGIAVFADTTGLHYPLPALTAFSYIWHILLIITGIAAGAVYLHLFCGIRKALFSRTLSRAFPLRSFLYSTFLYLGCCLAAVLLNLFLDQYGKINLFYINPITECSRSSSGILSPFSAIIPSSCYTSPARSSALS